MRLPDTGPAYPPIVNLEVFPLTLPASENAKHSPGFFTIHSLIYSVNKNLQGTCWEPGTGSTIRQT